MDARQGEIITVRHYSLLNVFKSVIAEVKERSLVFKILKEFAGAYFSVGDPIVLAFSNSEKVRITGGRIIGYNSFENVVEVELDKRQGEAGSRQFERAPISHYADIRIKNNDKKRFALVKDISSYGMLIFMNEDLCVGELLDIDVFLDRDIMSLKAEVAWKLQGPVHTEYGLKIIHRGSAAYNLIINYVRKSQES